MAAEMTSKDRVRTAIARKAPDRVPITDGPWAATVARWGREGLPAHQTSAQYFNYDLRPPRPCLSSQMTNEGPVAQIVQTDGGNRWAFAWGQRAPRRLTKR